MTTQALCSSTSLHAVLADLVAAYAPPPRLVYATDDRLGVVDTDGHVRVLGVIPKVMSSLAVSPDGEWIAHDHNEDVMLWHPGWEEKTLFSMRAHRGHMHSLAFSPDGHTLGSCSTAGHVTLHDFAVAKNTREWKISYQNGGLISRIAFAPTAPHHTLASCGSLGTIPLWDVRSGHSVHVLRGHVNMVNSIAFSPDGNELVSGSRDSTAHVWDLRTFKITHTLYHQNYHEPRAVEFTPDGRTVLVQLTDGSARLWNPRSTENQTVRCTCLSVNGGTTDVSAATFAPSGELAAACSARNGTLELWNAATGEFVCQSQTGVIRHMKFTS